MAKGDLTELQTRIASFLDTSSTVPTTTSKEYIRRTNYINRAQQEWSEVYDWRSLYNEYHELISAPSGTSTHSLPDGTTPTLPAFRKMAGHPIIDGDVFTDVSPFERPDISSSSRISYILGTPSLYKLVIRWAESPAGLVSMTLPYYSSPASLTTGTEISPCPDPEFLIAKAIAMELRSLVKDHERAEAEDARAELILKRMIETENTLSYGNTRTIKTPERKKGFVFGEDG